METAIVSLICIALVFFGGMTISQGFFTSVDATTTELGAASSRGEEIMRTELASVSGSLNAAGNIVTLTMENSGQTKVADFSKWDVIIQYHDGDDQYYVTWFPYSDGALTDNTWTVHEITLNGNPEAFEPNILNSEENIAIQVQLNPSVGDGTINMATVSTPNGIPVSITFSGN